jgi:PleD family two-component response regulator
MSSQSAGYQIVAVKTVEAGVRAATRRSGKENTAEGFPSGGEDFIIKQPIDNNELLAKVKSLLGD